MNDLNNSREQTITGIIVGCQKQNRMAQKALYYRFYSYGLTICLHYTKNQAEAEEILHDGFLKVFKKISQFQHKSAFRSWFRSILIRIIIDYYRKSKVVKRYPQFELSKEDHQVDNEAILKLQKDDVILVLQQLPPKYRIVFNLFVMEGYKHEEIADLLGISVGTSKSNLSRAKQKLRFLLKTSNALEG